MPPKRTPPLPPDANLPPEAELRTLARGLALPIYEVITAAELRGACLKIAAGLATIESAITAISGHTRQSIWRAMNRAEKALERQEAGEKLTERELRAIYFCCELAKADAACTSTLLARAQGIGPRGGSAKENAAALQLLRLRLQSVDLQRAGWLAKQEKGKGRDGEDTQPATPAQVEAAIRKRAAEMGLNVTDAADG
jgi:hypothetical protein